MTRRHIWAAALSGTLLVAVGGVAISIQGGETAAHQPTEHAAGPVTTATTLLALTPPTSVVPEAIDAQRLARGLTSETEVLGATTNRVVHYGDDVVVHTAGETLALDAVDLVVHSASVVDLPGRPMPEAGRPVAVDVEVANRSTEALRIDMATVVNAIDETGRRGADLIAPSVAAQHSSVRRSALIAPGERRRATTIVLVSTSASAVALQPSVALDPTERSVIEVPFN